MVSEEGRLGAHSCSDPTAEPSLPAVHYPSPHPSARTRHVLAAVVAAALHHGVCARVAHAEALSGHAPEVSLALGCACSGLQCSMLRECGSGQMGNGV